MRIFPSHVDYIRPAVISPRRFHSEKSATIRNDCLSRPVGRCLDNRSCSNDLFPRMPARILLSKFSLYGTSGDRGWFDVALR